MGIVIREALAKDAGQLIQHLKEIGGESDNLSFGEGEFSVTPEQEEMFLENLHNDKTSIFLVACKDGEIVGNGSLSGMPRRMSHRAELSIAVRKHYWGQGIGSMLMKELIQYAKENGIEIINLDVRKDNEQAIRLYEKFGFRHIGTSPAYFKIKEEYIDFAVMYLDLR